MTFEELVKLEPRLGDVLAKAKVVRADGPNFCSARAWFGNGRNGLKHEMWHLVGMDRPGDTEADHILQTSEAYDLAYRIIHDALPNCRHASPFC